MNAKAAPEKKTKKYSSKKKVPNAMSLTEFKAFLNGIEVLQPKDWHPDGNQWKMIRSMIDNIVEGASPVRSNNPYEPTYHARAPQPSGPSALNMPPNLPPPGGSIPAAAGSMPVSIGPNPGTPIQELDVNAAIVPGGKSGGVKFRTPNIDTSNGNYTPAFE